MAFVISDRRIPRECLASLKDLGFETVLLPSASEIEEAIASHTDILLFSADGVMITSEKYRQQNKELFSFLEEKLPYRKFIYTKEHPEGNYPQNALFNALVINDNVFLNKDSVSPAVLNWARERGMTVTEVKQGYPACTVLPIGSRAAITADKGMARAMEKAGIEVTLIENSEKILLPPYKFGFIGGSAGEFNNEIYFIGDIEAHPQFEKIKEAIGRAGYKWTSLGKGLGALYDLGGLVFAG